MIDWKIKDEGYNQDKISYIGNKFLIGNGYMGVRGTLDEYEKGNLVAVNLAGVYDKTSDGWREPLNAPNAFYTYIVVDGQTIKLPEVEAQNHYIELDYRHGIFRRVTRWNCVRGNIIVESERFVSMEDVHLGVMKYKVTADFHADIHIVCGIDADVWELNGPHYDEIEYYENDIIGLTATTHEKKYKVNVLSGVTTRFGCEEKTFREDKKILKSINFITDIDRCYEIERYFSIYTSKECADCSAQSKKSVISAMHIGYAKTLNKQVEVWENLWKLSEVTIVGDDNAMMALNYSAYHLHSIAPRHAANLSIAARGLSGQTYKGAVFWDTEIFIMDFFLMTEPKVARELIKYRIDSLPGAKKKAKEYGYQGAFYPWESQEEGFDACSDYNIVDVFTQRPMRTYFKDKQIHISAAIVYGIAKYLKMTGDVSILSEGGANVIIECARFYYDRLIKRVNRNGYELRDVIGPDEYHERVNNNVYTNRMAKFTLEQAVNVIENRQILSKEANSEIENTYNLENLKNKFEDAVNNIYMPESNAEEIIPQFDGYFDLEDVSVQEVRERLINPKEYWGGAYGVASQTQVIKQADVVSYLSMFPNDVNQETKLKNWEYYAKRTEHGSSLSACMYGLLACKCNMPDKAYPFFMKSAKADLEEGGKDWAGLTYIGGTHPAAAGGAYMVAIKGFAGVSIEEEKIKVKPKLPQNWEKMVFNIQYKNTIYKISAGNNTCIIDKQS